jgi:hypothetical protein
MEKEVMAPLILGVNKSNWQNDYITAVAAVLSSNAVVAWNSAPEPGLFPPMPNANVIFWFSAAKNLTMLNPGGTNALTHAIYGDWPMAFEQALRNQQQWQGNNITNVWTPLNQDGIIADQTAIMHFTNQWASLD